MTAEGPGNFTYCANCHAQEIIRDRARVTKICSPALLNEHPKYTQPSSCTLNFGTHQSSTLQPQQMAENLIRSLRSQGKL